MKGGKAFSLGWDAGYALSQRKGKRQKDLFAQIFPEKFIKGFLAGHRTGKQINKPYKKK